MLKYYTVVSNEKQTRSLIKIHFLKEEKYSKIKRRVK